MEKELLYLIEQNIIKTKEIETKIQLQNEKIKPLREELKSVKEKREELTKELQNICSDPSHNKIFSFTKKLKSYPVCKICHKVLYTPTDE
jgi:uncharacterized coiled-coil DUF342 family protein